MWQWQEIQEVSWRPHKTAVNWLIKKGCEIVESIYLDRDRLTEIKETVKELGVSL